MRTRDFRDYTYVLAWHGAPESVGIGHGAEVRVTFDPAIADAFPPTAPPGAEAQEEGKRREGIRLLTWGDPLLEGWLEAPCAAHPCRNMIGVRWACNAANPATRLSMLSLGWTREPIKEWRRFCDLLNGTIS